VSANGSTRGPVAIRSAVQGNQDFRRELMTGTFAQVVLMTIQPGDDIGEEIHEDTDQILVFVSGQGMAILDGEKSELQADDLVFVQAGTRHNFVNTGDEPLRLFTIYAPPEHAPGTVHHTKAEAAAEH
jgi:mannose-6-phosphate isomerase-like protein (cupin superfamily)